MIIINSYDELRYWFQMFSRGNSNMTLVCSRGGLGKSEIAKEVFVPKDDYLWLNSHITPLRLFQLGQDNADKPMVFDDVDCLFQNKQNVALLKQYCETTPRRTIQWNSTIDLGDGRSSCFVSSSPVFFISNKLSIFSSEALATRGFIIRFVPTVEEIVKRMEEILPDMKIAIPEEEKEEVLDFIKDNQDKVALHKFNLRTLDKGLKLIKDSRMWKDKLMTCMAYGRGEEKKQFYQDNSDKFQNLSCREQAKLMKEFGYSVGKDTLRKWARCE